MQVVIPCYADADFLVGALDTLPRGWSVHVVDGRLAGFDSINGCDHTPEAVEVCTAFENVTYHCPPPALLPFGEGGDIVAREPQHEQARYILTCIDESAWTLKMDTDERLRRFDVDTGALNPGRKYLATVDGHRGRTHYVPRLWVPEHWSFWTDDLQVRREQAARDSLEDIIMAIDRGEFDRHQSVETLEDILIENIGAERPADYTEARTRHRHRMTPTHDPEEVT